MNRIRPFSFDRSRRVRMPNDATLRVCWALRSGMLDEEALFDTLGATSKVWGSKALDRAVREGLVRPCGPPMIPGTRLFDLTRKGESAIRRWTGQPRERYTLESALPSKSSLK